MEMPLLWHIPLSHYSEKARWALDYKRIAHRRQVLGADYLIRAWRATGQGKLPILWLDGRAIADSTRIIAALEERYPEPPLYPCDAAARQRALVLEDNLDETLGPALRAAIVTPLFRNDPDIALRVLTTGMPTRLTAGCGRWSGFSRRTTGSATRSARPTWRRIAPSSRRRSTASSRSDKAARISLGRLSPSLTSRLPRCWGRSCSHPRCSTRCRSSCRRICWTTAPRCCGIRPRSGRPRSTACIADTPRQFPIGQLRRHKKSSQARQV